MGYFNWADNQLKNLLEENKTRTYKGSPYVGMRLGMANQTLNSRIPGAEKFTRNIMSSGQTSFNNAAKYATDASQLLGVNAGIQGQTDQELSDLQLMEADWKKFGLGNLNDAYGAMTEEERFKYGADQENFQNEVSLRGAQAANKMAKRKALWNTVGDIAQLGVSAFTGGANSAASAFGNLFVGSSK